MRAAHRAVVKRHLIQNDKVVDIPLERHELVVEANDVVHFDVDRVAFKLLPTNTGTVEDLPNSRSANALTSVSDVLVTRLIEERQWAFLVEIQNPFALVWGHFSRCNSADLVVYRSGSVESSDPLANGCLGLAKHDGHVPLSNTEDLDAVESVVLDLGGSMPTSSALNPVHGA